LASLGSSKQRFTSGRRSMLSPLNRSGYSYVGSRARGGQSTLLFDNMAQGSHWFPPTAHRPACAIALDATLSPGMLELAFLGTPDEFTEKPRFRAVRLPDFASYIMRCGLRCSEMESFKIVLGCVLAAVLYGIVHDQFTARICLEYFTVFHPPVFQTQSPTLLGFEWGVIAT
jgi:hypothetical protein